MSPPLFTFCRFISDDEVKAFPPVMVGEFLSAWSRVRH